MTLGVPLDDLYLEWLYKKIGLVRNKNLATSYWQLAKKLYSTEFIYFVPNDENRAWDGMDLREDFLTETPSAEYDDDWCNQECSMLEMMLGLAYRADFLADRDVMAGGVGAWFWEFAKNVGLKAYTDNTITTRSLEEIEFILDRVNNRTYSRNGEGGLLPNYKSRRDQRRVELWSQLNAYLLNNGFVDPSPDT